MKGCSFIRSEKMVLMPNGTLGGGVALNLQIWNGQDVLSTLFFNLLCPSVYFGMSWESGFSLTFLPLAADRGQ